MTLNAASGCSVSGQPDTAASLRTCVAVLLSVLVVPSLVVTAGAEGFDSYATVEDSSSILVEEGVVPTPSSYEPAAGEIGYGYSNSAGMECPAGYCPGCPQCRGYSQAGTGMLNRICGDACPRWTAQIDALMLWQTNIPAVPILILDDPANPATFLSTNQLLTDIAVGPRAALMLHVDQCHAIEGNYFYVGSIGSTRSFEAPLPTQLVWDNVMNISQFGNIDSGTITSNGEIQSFELNWRHRPGDSVITWLVGFRWVEWNESLRLADSYSSPSGFGDDLLDVQTGNDLYGAQIGLDALLLTLWESIRFNGVAKAGVYGNDATASTFVQTDRPGFGADRSFSGSVSQTGFFGEVGINGSVRLSEHFFWRAGYNFFWLSGVAVTSQQLAAVDAAADPATGTVTAGSSVFLSGVNTGIEFIW